MKRGDRARFFDSNSAWKTTGDIGDNDIYFFPATVVNVYNLDGRETVDIVFDKQPDRVRKGFFTGIIKTTE